MKSKLKYLILALLFLYLFCFPQQAADAVREGLTLWYTSVLPVLFPFMLLCGIVLRLDLALPLVRRINGPVQALLGCSGYGGLAIFIGFLCGFPMGAKLTADLRRQGKIAAQEANFLFGFVNNLSPVFILSYLAADQMQKPGLGPLFLTNILGAALLYGVLSSFYYRKKIPASEYALPVLSKPEKEPAGCFAEADLAINETIWNTVRLGAYIVIFSVLSRALSGIAGTGNPVTLFLLSCIEVSNGVRLISSSSLSFPAKYILLGAACAFGGLSALMQTVSIAEMDLPTTKRYIKSRAIITLLSVFLSSGSVLLF